MAFAFGGILLYKAINRFKQIDTESVATVKEIIPLGRSGLRKICAIKYDVHCSNPFELIETPCKKAKKIGKQRTVFFQSDNAKQNFYFKTIGHLDRRFWGPVTLLCIGIFLFIMTFIPRG